MKIALMVLLVLLLALVQTATAQHDDEIQPPPINFPIAIGVDFTIAQPTGEFREYVKNGFGLDFHVSIPFDRQGIFSARIDAGFTNYGNETIRVPLSPTVGNLIMVDVTTSNNIFAFGVGPQLTFPTGPIRPYLATAIGGSYFATQSRVDGSNNQTPFAETTNFDDFVFTFTGGGGVLIPLGWHNHARFMLDLGTAYHHNGPTRYLREGSQIDLRDGSVDIEPIESRTSYFNFRVGVVVRTF